MEFLRQVPLLQCLPSSSLCKIADAIEAKHYGVRKLQARTTYERRSKRVGRREQTKEKKYHRTSEGSSSDVKRIGRPSRQCWTSHQYFKSHQIGLQIGHPIYSSNNLTEGISDDLSDVRCAIVGHLYNVFSRNSAMRNVYQSDIGHPKKDHRTSDHDFKGLPRHLLFGNKCHRTSDDLLIGRPMGQELSG